jgi:hypothetical protein
MITNDIAGSTPEPASEQIEALNILLDYWTDSGVLEVREILKDTGLTEDAYQNFRRRRSKKPYSRLASYLEEKITSRQKRSDGIPSFLRSVITECFPRIFWASSNAIRSPNDIFLKHAKAGKEVLNEISNTYSGIFLVYRYSSHLDKEPADIILETASDGQVIKKDPWMICSAMEIIPPKSGDDFVRFKILYRPFERVAGGKLSEIDGIIVAIHELLYFIGLEKTKYPLVIMTVPRYEHKIDLFTGMILRYHEFRRTISSRVGFRRAPDSVKSLNELDDKIGLVTESNVADIIAEFEGNLINVVQYRGKAALLATD